MGKPLGRSGRLGLLASSILSGAALCAACLLILPYLGIQNDEALFAAPLYAPKHAAAWLWHPVVPLMQMTYLGSVKTWIYAPLFAIFEPSVATLRLPVVFLSVLTLWLWMTFLRQASDRILPSVVGVLVATDAIYVVTSTFDWGPVVLQRLFFIAGVLAIWLHWKKRLDRYLVVGGAALGLGLWDKAIFVWILSASILVALVVGRTAVRDYLKPRTVVLGAASIVMGASPLLLYNVRHPGVTLTQNVAISFSDLQQKWQVATSTIEGQALLGYLVRDTAFVKGTERGGQQRALDASSVTKWTTAQRSLLLYGFTCATIALPAMWFSRYWGLYAWSLGTAMVAFLEMALNQRTGSGAHHIALLWPLPHVVIGSVIAAVLSRSGVLARIGGYVALAALVIANLLVLNRYIQQAKHVGSGPMWTDAIFRLAATKSLEQSPVYVMDWGILDSLRLLSQGRVDLRVGWEKFVAGSGDEDEGVAWLRSLPDLEESRFVFHTNENEVYEGVAARFRQAADQTEVRLEKECMIADRQGREMFEVWRAIRLGDSELQQQRADQAPQ